MQRLQQREIFQVLELSVKEYSFIMVLKKIDIKVDLQ